MKQISLQWVKSPRTLSILSRRNENLKQGAEARADAGDQEWRRLTWTRVPPQLVFIARPLRSKTLSIGTLSQMTSVNSSRKPASRRSPPDAAPTRRNLLALVGASSCSSADAARDKHVNSPASLVDLEGAEEQSAGRMTLNPSAVPVGAGRNRATGKIATARVDSSTRAC